jgi:hypothetical protein
MKKLSVSAHRNFSDFVEPKISLPYSQGTVTEDR